LAYLLKIWKNGKNENKSEKITIQNEIALHSVIYEKGDCLAQYNTTKYSFLFIFHIYEIFTHWCYLTN